MCACHGHVRLPVGRVLAPEGSKPLQDAIALGGVASCYIQHQVDEPVIWVVNIANDEGPGVEPLPQAGTGLAEVGVPSEFNLDDGACDVGLADPYSVVARK